MTEKKEGFKYELHLNKFEDENGHCIARLMVPRYLDLEIVDDYFQLVSKIEKSVFDHCLPFPEVEHFFTFSFADKNGCVFALLDLPGYFDMEIVNDFSCLVSKMEV